MNDKNSPEISTIYDKIGNEIKVGDYILYGCSLDRSAGLQMGKVVGFGIGRSNFYGENIYIKIINENGARTSLKFPSRVVVVTSIYDETHEVKLHHSWNNESKVIDWPKGENENG